MSRLNALLKFGKTEKIRLSAIPACLPFSIDPPGAREAVLILHGFTGNPAEMRPLGEALAAAGYAVHSPRYPGHGTNRADFMASGAADWLRRAIDARLDLGARYGVVHIVGHSMGGIIATAVASAFETSRLILLAPAFVLGIPGSSLAPWIEPFTKVLVKNRELSPADRNDPVRVTLHEAYWKDDMIGPSADLVRFSKKGRKNLERVNSRVLALLGTEDRAVPLTVAPLLETRLRNAASVDIRTIEGAGHLFPFDERAEETAKTVVDWLRG